MRSKIVQEAKRKILSDHKTSLKKGLPVQIEHIFHPTDWPHIVGKLGIQKAGQGWQGQFGLVSKCAEKLRNLNVPDSEIDMMFRELFWACYAELDAKGMIQK
jgi:hypothetical protein